MLDPALFPSCVAVESADPALVDGVLFAEEERAIERAVDGRRREYRAGRVLARRALERIGLAAGPIPSGPDRAPVWPHEVVGTITHTRDLCAVAVARRDTVLSLGCDVERPRPLKDGVLRRVLTEAEQRRLERDDPAWRSIEATLLFSAKEAFYKCLYPLRPRFVAFHEVEIDLLLEEAAFRVHAPALQRDAWPAATRFEGRIAWSATLVQAAMVAHRA